MNSEQREKLLLARSDELEREYRDLVRALDAAYEGVRSINAALTENRAESRRLFQERLAVAASPKENGLLACRSSNGDAGAGAPTGSIRLLRKYVTKKVQRDDATVTGQTVRLADQTLLFEKSVAPGNDTSISNGGRSDSAARLASDAMLTPKNIYQQLREQQQQRATKLNHHHRHHRTSTTTAQQQLQQSAARGAYVGDEHSYAVNDGSDEGKDNEEPAPAAGILNGGAPTWHAVFHEEEEDSATAVAKGRTTVEEEVTHGEMDLSIVKCEWPDETSDSTCPTSTTTIASPSIQPQPTTTSETSPVQPKSSVKTIGRLIAISATLTQSPRKRGRTSVCWRNVQEEDEERKRKRRQTRDRMRRWRAKKRLERQ